MCVLVRIAQGDLSNPLAYQVNDIVQVFPDGYDFGRPDASFEPKFKVERLEGEPESDYKHLEQCHESSVSELIPVPILVRGGPAYLNAVHQLVDKGRPLKAKRRYNYDAVTNSIKDKEYPNAG